MRALVTGAAGMLGRDLAPLVAGSETLCLTRNQADLADPQALDRAVGGFRPEIVFHLAAFTDVDGCELDPARAERDNVRATENVAALAARAQSRLLHISTDYVFDGKATRPIPPDAPTGPLSVYGRTKLAAEEAVRHSGARFLIVRTAWLVGVHGKNFVEAIRQRARTEETLRVVCDQYGTPTFTFDLAPALVALAARGTEGVLHVTNQGECSRYEQAAEVLRQEGLKTPLVAVSTGENPRPAARPAYSVLDNSAAIGILGKPLPPWREALSRYLALRPAPAL